MELSCCLLTARTSQHFFLAFKFLFFSPALFSGVICHKLCTRLSYNAGNVFIQNLLRSFMLQVNLPLIKQSCSLSYVEIVFCVVVQFDS